MYLSSIPKREHLLFTHLPLVFIPIVRPNLAQPIEQKAKCQVTVSDV